MSLGTFLNDTVKRSVPKSAYILDKIGLISSLNYVEKYFSFLQGKGNGSGWDLESEVRAAAKFINNSDPFVIDVGANTGEWSMALKGALDRDVEFLLVEPQQVCMTKLNSLPIKKTILDCAISDSDKTLDFYQYGNSKLSSVHERQDTLVSGKKASLVKVPARSIDSLLLELGIDRVDFVKMDLEGHELFAMKGAINSIHTGKIRCMSFEFGISNLNSKVFFQEIYQFLSTFRFTLYRILPGGLLYSIPEYSEELERFYGVANYIVRFDRGLALTT